MAENYCMMIGGLCACGEKKRGPDPPGLLYDDLGEKERAATWSGIRRCVEYQVVCGEKNLRVVGRWLGLSGRTHGCAERTYE